MVLSDYEDYEGDVEYEYYDEQYREKMILRFKYEGTACKTGFRFWIKKEREEYAKRMISYKAKKFKSVVDVASDDEPSLASQQQGYSSPSDGEWSQDFSQRIEPSTSRSSTTSYESPVPLHWNHHLTKKRTARSNYKMLNQERPKKCQKMIGMKAKEEHNQLKRKEKMKSANKKQRKNVKRRSPVPPPPPPPRDMPIELRQAITELGGTNPVWLSEKKLTKSDTETHLSRLFWPHNAEAKLVEFMTIEENNEMMRKGGGLSVLVVDTSGEHLELDFKIWHSLKKYVLTGVNWNIMVKNLGMQPKSDTIQLWCFRLPAENESKLCFAANIEKGQPISEDEDI